MKLTIGSTTFEGASAKRMRDNKEGFYLFIKIPTESTAMNGNEVRALFNGTTETIVAINEDGTENNYNGYNKALHFTTEDNEYTFWQVCRSELEAQLGLAKDEIKALKIKNAEYAQDISNQNSIIANCISTINRQAAMFVEINEQLLITQEELCATYEELTVLKAARAEKEAADESLSKAAEI